MPPKSSFFILLTCFFMHACNSRFLGLTNNDFHKMLPQDKIHEEKLRVSMNFSPNSRGTIDSRMPRWGTISSKPKEEGAGCKKNKGNKGATSEKVLHSSIFSEEDLIETDYQPPQRKSPIHN
ncbi:hypothetical protein Pfo_014956 [Paulownia fortunei]|nr:hypothetical protein Pfo_014956 [Paulownia fortunei]